MYLTIIYLTEQIIYRAKLISFLAFWYFPLDLNRQFWLRFDSLLTASRGMKKPNNFLKGFPLKFGELHKIMLKIKIYVATLILLALN